MFPLHIPLLEPTHQVVFLSWTCLDDPLNVPVAVNCTCPPGKFCASAVAGLIVTEVSLLLPHPRAPKTAKRVKDTTAHLSLLIVEHPLGRIMKR